MELRKSAPLQKAQSERRATLERIAVDPRMVPWPMTEHPEET
jgi:hypothetical protein